ncbi:UDP-glucose--hexose-1-phosphate uridylyltransferase, partial [Enterococcus faecium]
MSISQTICDFATLAIEAGGWMEMDRLYLQNRLLGMVGEDALESIEVRPVKEESVDLLDQLVAKARDYSKSPEEATEYFFNLSKKNDYIKTRAIAKNIKFPAESE